MKKFDQTRSNWIESLTLVLSVGFHSSPRGPKNMDGVYGKSHMDDDWGHPGFMEANICLSLFINVYHVYALKASREANCFCLLLASLI